ncbi:MAG: hypothetical protein K9H65_02540 [Bacteroidales bacterium]|nr:hypothetical protein [Bacteroidales bacterium]
MAQQNKVTYKISAIETLDLEMKHPKQQNIDFNTFHFDLKLQHRINAEKKLVFVITNISIMDKDKSSRVGYLETSCIFEVENFNDYLTSDEESNVKFPDSFINEINSMAISTTRGIMFSEFKGTFLHKAVLPVFQSEQLSKDQQEKQG